MISLCPGLLCLLAPLTFPVSSQREAEEKEMGRETKMGEPKPLGVLPYYLQTSSTCPNDLSAEYLKREHQAGQ